MPLVLQLLPLFLVIIVVPILLARQRRGLSTWFPAQLLALFGLVGGIIVQHHGFGVLFDGQPPLITPMLGAAAGAALASLVPGSGTGL